MRVWEREIPKPDFAIHHAAKAREVDRLGGWSLGNLLKVVLACLKPSTQRCVFSGSSAATQSEFHWYAKKPSCAHESSEKDKGAVLVHCRCSKPCYRVAKV